MVNTSLFRRQSPTSPQPSSPTFYCLSPLPTLRDETHSRRSSLRLTAPPRAFLPLVAMALAGFTSTSSPHAEPTAPVVGSPTPSAPMHRILHVGPEKEFSKPSEAAAAVRPGDIVEVASGTYADCAVWPRHARGITIEAAGNDVTIADKTCADKGIFVIQGDDVTVRGITFMHAKATDHNGSGIRAEGRNLTVERSRFIDNEDGILATRSIADSTIIVRNSYFKGNGNCIALCAHGIYVGRIAKLVIERSHFIEQHIGHHVKSRARLTELVGNTIEDGPNGTASYLVDISNGGGLIMRDNRLEKGPRSDNPSVAVTLAAEGNSNPSAEITIEHNTFNNNLAESTLFVRNGTVTAATLTGNRLTGRVIALRGPGTVDTGVSLPISQGR